MLRQPLIAAAFVFAAVTAAGRSDAAPPAAQTANIPIFATPAASQTASVPIFAAPAGSSNAPSVAAAPPPNHRPPVRYRTVVHHVYRYEPAPAPYYYGPNYRPAYAPAAPAAPVAALPAAAACLALSLLGGC